MARWPREVIAVIGVTTSPSCGTNFESISPYQPSGIYMEELREAVNVLGISPKFISIWPKHQHKMMENLNGLLARPDLLALAGS